ncbi:portal protein [Kistimonas asteriae]|uniref:portal protein n=1 Tax=Kistimonas asteriae TaxID=517724 RepID=UPI001BA85D0F|nr:hypothetical protein [Kistimonas asteriae]
MYQPHNAPTAQSATLNAVNVPNTDAEAQAEQTTELVKDALAGDLYSQWERRKDARREIETEWLDAYRAIKGEHSPEALSRMAENGQLSQLFVKITLTKVNAAYSRLIDMLFQQVDSFWDIVPSPIASLPKAIKDVIRNQARQDAVVMAMQEPVPAQQRAALVEQLQPQILTKLEDAIMADSLDSAEEACVSIRRQIKDYLVQAEALTALKKTVYEMVCTGTGCFKTATVKYLERQGWESDDDGQWNLTGEKTIAPDVEHVSIWEVYPNSWATDPKDPEDVIRRRVLTRSELRQLASVPRFDGDRIGEILTDTPNGNHEDEQWERTLRNLNDNDERYQDASKRYDVFEYWGLIDGADLERYGVKVDDPYIEYQANVWFTGNRVIMASLNPLKPESIPYKFVPYQTLAHRFWGMGIPAMMSDAQASMNAAVNALLDNVALTAGPMLDIDVARLPESVTLDEARKIYPFKVNFYDSSKGGEGPAVKVNNIQSNQTQLQAVFEMFRRFADEETSLPSYTHGEQGQSMNKTATGMSMLMSAANVALKSVVKNIDDYLTRPLIDSLYHFTMRWSDIESKRGDLDVVAQGSSALVAKELQSQKLMQVMSFTANPVDGPRTNRGYLLEEYLRANDLDTDKAMVSDEEFNAQLGQGNGAGPAGAPVQHPLPGANGLPQGQPG